MDEKQSEQLQNSSLNAILLALFENYESIYMVDAETSAYRCYHESEAFRKLEIAERGDDFFGSLCINAERTIFSADRKYVCAMLSKDAMLKALSDEKQYSFVYRVLLNGVPTYYKLQAVMDTIDNRPTFLIGVRNIDAAVRFDQANNDKLASLYQKEKNHMEAILATAASYLEANLTRDEVLEFSSHLPSAADGTAIAQPPKKEHLTYSELEQWRQEACVVGNAKKYAQVSDRQHLIECFQQGVRRTSVSFSVRGAGGSERACRKMFYLYQDNASGDIHTFCVVYDMTEQQRKEMEMEKLEEELRMSRIHNSTSQMQPHFLYNALGSIQEIILEDPEYAAKLLGDFTLHLRSCVRAMENDDPISFVRELENIRAYANIEKMRLGNKLKIRYDIQAEAFSIVPLSIQPLVENAIRHGVYERGMAGGTVTVRSRELPHAFLVEVEDDGVGFDYPALEKEIAAGKRDSTGLKNIMLRLDKVMRARVQIDSRVGVGTKVTVTIPKGEAKDANNPG